MFTTRMRSAMNCMKTPRRSFPAGFGNSGATTSFPRAVRSTDRAVLSGRLFGAADRAAAFAALNAIVHPAVEKRLRECLERDAEDDGLALVEVPLLFEIGWDRKFLRTIAVWTPRELQIARLMARGGMSREDAESRLSVQMSGDARLAKADFGLINNGSSEHLRKQCFALTALLKTLPL